jgi:hypothetical protein
MDPPDHRSLDRRAEEAEFEVRTAALLLCVLLAGPALAQPAPPKPDALTPDGARYYGPLRNGNLHGQGRLVWANGTVYDGGFADGLMSGRGKVRWANEQAYEGEFRDGMMDGHGRMTMADGAVYEGQFRRSYFSGQGAITYADGRKYRGDFVLGNFQGNGRYETPEGEVHEGEFKNGQFSGRGMYRRPDGARYEGEFLKWRMHGKGRFTDPAGSIYEGTFANGELEGKGTLTGPHGNRYSGDFKLWRFHGHGELRLASGDVYRGGFADGNYDGQGTLTFAKPRADGATQQSGVWRFGMLETEQREQRRLATVNVESALYNQRTLLAQAIGALAPRDPARINLFLLAIGGDGSQEVFRREVEFVRGQFAQRFGTAKHSVALINSRSTVGTAPMATATSIREALAAFAARMDREQDILFLFLTSHGSRGHELVLNQNGMDLPDLSAADLGRLLRESGIRWKVVVISACYSGGFLDPLKDDGTLVITAARHDRQSFGCADENEFTYFGRAYFKEALPQASSFQDAFRKAEVIVKEMETRAPGEPAPGGKPAEAQHSLPQMRSPAPIERQLQRWWSQKR